MYLCKTDAKQNVIAQILGRNSDLELNDHYKPKLGISLLLSVTECKQFGHQSHKFAAHCFQHHDTAYIKYFD